MLLCILLKMGPVFTCSLRAALFPARVPHINLVLVPIRASKPHSREHCCFGVSSPAGWYTKVICPVSWSASKEMGPAGPCCGWVCYIQNPPPPCKTSLKMTSFFQRKKVPPLPCKTSLKMTSLFQRKKVKCGVEVPWDLEGTVE